MLRRWCLVGFVFSQLACAGAEPNPASTEHKFSQGMLPVTTSSPQARRSFERAMRRFEDYRLNDTLQDLREAVKADPKFAQAYILIAKISKDPSEQAAARRRAEKLAAAVSPGEALLIRWLADAQKDNYLPAIAAMNDVLEMYPDDARLAFLAGDWLDLQGRYEQSKVVLEHALSLQPNYPAALNDLGYTYAYDSDFPKAFAAMDRYVALQPDQPNPHDSYGEILRMAGKFDAALEQYRASVRMDPNFGSELGVADTLALMGKEQDARDEYARAIVFAGSQTDKIQFELQSALTWIREGDRKQAEKALLEVAKHAHAAELCTLEAEAHRILAMYEPDPKHALRHIVAAQLALQESHDMSASDRDEELARVYRVQAVRAAEFGEMGIANQATNQLESMLGKSRSRVTQLCYASAVGAVFVAQGKFSEAISHLEEDSSDPVSLRLLWRAYGNAGSNEQTQATATRLAALNVPTVEQALVVPQFRASLVSQARQP